MYYIFHLLYAFKSAIIYIAFILLMINIGYGQDLNLYLKNGNESFFNLPEGVIKNEIALFSINASTSQKSLSKVRLNEIPLKKCSNSFAFFEKGNIIASEVIIGIYSGKGSSSEEIIKIKYIHFKYGFTLPDSVIKGIYTPVFCTEYTKNGKPVTSSCKVYQSEDEKRIYIYMLNGQGRNRYEVTWIIKNDKYYARVIDMVD